MSSITKPALSLDWIVSGDVAKIIEPSVGLKLTGYTAGDKPAARNFNWLMYYTDQWQKWLEGCNQFDAVIGANGSHANFAALFADTNIANIRNILVIDKFTSVQTIPSGYNGKRFTFKRGAGVDPTTGNGLLIQSSGHDLLGPTIFSGSCGIYIDSGALNNIIINYRCLDAVTLEYVDTDSTGTNSFIGIRRGTI